MKKIIDQIVTRLLLRIIIHCSATPDGKDFTAKDINTWHINRGWKSIGYHFVILLDGTIEVGRPIGQIGAHTLGFNKDSIGICYIGGLDKDGKIPKDTRTPEQIKSMHWLVEELTRKYPSIIEVRGHRDYSPDKNGDGIIEPWEWLKACPCFDVIPEFIQYVKNKLS